MFESMRLVSLMHLWALISIPAFGQEKIESLATFPGPISAIRMIDQQILASSQDSLYLLDLDGKIIRECKLPIHQVTSLEISGDREMIWVGGGDPGVDGKVVGVPPEPFKPEKVFELHSDVISSLAISPDGSRLMAGSTDHEISILDLHSGQFFQLVGHSKAITGVAWVDDVTVVSTSEDMSVRVWDARERKLVRTMNQHVGAALGIRALQEVDSIRPVVATWGKDRTVRFWQPTIGRMMRFTVLDGVPLVVCWDAEAEKLVVGDSTGSVSWISWETGKIIHSENLSDEWVTALEFDNKSGHYLIGMSSGELFRVAVPGPKQPS